MDLGGGFGAQVGGAMGTGGVLGGETPSDAPGIQGPDGLFDINLSAYSPAPDVPLEPSEPSTIDNLNKAFSSVPEVTPTPEWPSESRFVEAWGHPTAPYSEATVKEIGIILNQTVTTILSFVPFGNLIKGWVDVLFGAPLGTTVSKGLAGVRMTRGESAMSKFAFPESSTPSEGNLESVLSLSPIEKAPSSYPSASYGKAGYPSLSTSLFGASKESSGGLMIFPTSTKGIEAEASSLLGPGKKQEPVIDSKSILFLFGMTALGIVLRKGARA
jgi:hypothetical protein